MTDQSDGSPRGEPKLRYPENDGEGCYDDLYSIWDRCYELPDFPQESVSARERAYGWRGLEMAYAEASGVLCTGIRLGGHEHEHPIHCHLPFCPSCWYRTNMAIGQLLETVEAPYWYVRGTNEVRWDEMIHPSVMTRFRADGNGTGYSLVAWAVTVLQDPEAELTDCQYRYVGLWTSDRPIKSKVGGIFDPKDRSHLLGSVEVEAYGDKKWDAVARFFQHYQHPSYFKDDPMLRTYIESMWRPIDQPKDGDERPRGRIRAFRHIRFDRNPLYVPGNKIGDATDRLDDGLAGK